MRMEVALEMVALVHGADMHVALRYSSTLETKGDAVEFEAVEFEAVEFAAVESGTVEFEAVEFEAVEFELAAVMCQWFENGGKVAQKPGQLTSPENGSVEALTSRTVRTECLLNGSQASSGEAEHVSLLSLQLSATDSLE